MALSVPQIESFRESDPLLYEAFQKVIAGINSVAGQVNVNASGQQIGPPAPPSALAVTQSKGVFTAVITENPSNTKPIEYYVEVADNNAYQNAVAYPLGATTTIALTLGTVTRYFRARAKYAGSTYSGYINANGSLDPLIGTGVNLDTDVTDGATYVRTTVNEKAGAADGYQVFELGISTKANKQGSIIPATGTSGPFGFYSSDAGASNAASAVLTWILVTQYRPDGTTFTVLSSATIYPWQPDLPIPASVAGGAKAAATVWGRCAYVKDGAIVGIGEGQSIALAINTLLKIPSPVLSHPLAAVWSTDTFTDVAGTLLENHVQTLSNGLRWTKLVGTSLKIAAGGVKLTVGAASTITSYFLQDHPWYDGYTVQVDVDLTTSAAATDFLGVLVHGRDVNNYYHVKCQGNGSIVLEKKAAAVVTTLQTLVGAFKTGTLKVTVTATSATVTQFQVYWNGVLQATWTDSSLPLTNAHGARVGINSSSAVLTVTFANWSVTDAAVPPALAVDGWVPLAGTAATTCQAQVDPRTPLALGTDWTEPAAGASHVLTYNASPWAGQNSTLESNSYASQFWTWNGGKAWLNKLGSIALAYSSSTVFYPTTDTNGATPSFGTGSGPVQPGTVALSAELFLDGRYPLCGSAGVSFTTPAAGGSGSGSGGGGCPKKGTIIKPLGSSAFGADFANEDWIEIVAENGYTLVATPTHQVITYQFGKRALQDRAIRKGCVMVTEVGKSKLKSVRRFKEKGAAVNMEMNEGHLYWAGGFLSSNLKP